MERSTHLPRTSRNRWAALQHLTAIGPGDLVAYDRGYNRCTLLHAHSERLVQAVFRLKQDASGLVCAFVARGGCNEVVTVERTETARRSQPAEELPPCRLRLVKYAIDGTVYALGTTLLDAELYPLADPADLYDGRRSEEELNKVSKEMLEIENFHSRGEWMVTQELSAHVTLIAMAWLFASRCERQCESRAGAADPPPLQANFSHSLGAVERERPGRSYPRQSRRPSKELRNCKPADPPTGSHPVFPPIELCLKLMRFRPKTNAIAGADGGLGGQPSHFGTEAFNPGSTSAVRSQNTIRAPSTTMRGSNVFTERPNVPLAILLSTPRRFTRFRML